MWIDFSTCTCAVNILSFPVYNNSGTCTHTHIMPSWDRDHSLPTVNLLSWQCVLRLIILLTLYVCNLPQVFFIDHKHRLTTFIDPRLPLPDQEFTYTTRQTSMSVSASRRSVLYSDESEVRPHHVTTGVGNTSVTSTDGISPTPSVTSPTSNPASVSGAQENGIPIDISSSTATPPCEIFL